MKFSTLAIGLAICASAFAQDLPKPEGFPLERFYKYPLLNGRSPSSPQMSPDGSKIVFGWNQTGVRKLDLWILDYPSGNKRLLVEANKVMDLPRQDDTRTKQDKDEAELYDGGISSATWSPDGKEILFSYKGRTFISDLNGSFQPLVDSNSGMFSVQYSPDGKYISYLSGSNLFRMARDGSKVKQLTFVSKPGTSIGDYSWSPDSKQIYVSWSDSSRMGNHVMMDFSKDRAQVVQIRRMWHGEKSVDAQHGIVSVEGGLIRFVQGLPRYHWSDSVEWAPDSSFLALGWTSEDFQQHNISLVSPSKEGDLKAMTVYTEKAPKNYIPDFRSLGWTRDSRRILFSTDIIDGKFTSRSLMSMEPSGRDLKPVFKEDYDLASWMRPKHSDRLILVTQKKSSLMSEITIQEPNGSRKIYDVVENGMAAPKMFDYSGQPLVSEDGTKIATLASTRTLNPELYSVEPVQKRLTVSQTEDFKKIKWADHTPFSFKAPDGATIHGVMITKPGLDKTKKHPAFISSMYANSGKLAWNGYFENYAAIELGFVVVQIDFRSSWGQGGEFNSGYYKSLGIVDSDEAVAAKEYLVSTGFVNPDRVGVWGWSYGGFLTCMIQLTKPGIFDTGVAVASVTDWNSYNEWYTRRRLGMQKDDPQIYEKTSPIYHSSGLKDNLFLVHGMLDDNVLFQDTARMMQKLIDDGKFFEVMAYPRDDHSIGKDTSRPHVFATIMRYLYWKLNR